jgi:hypothetical protein
MRNSRKAGPAELSAAAIAHLHQGGKIAAIKQVRREQGLGLAEAKELVDRYVANHPELQSVMWESQKGSGRFLFGVVFTAALAAVVYFWLMH